MVKTGGKILEVFSKKRDGKNIPTDYGKGEVQEAGLDCCSKQAT